MEEEEEEGERGYHHSEGGRHEKNTHKAAQTLENL